MSSHSLIFFLAVVAFIRIYDLVAKCSCNLLKRLLFRFPAYHMSAGVSNIQKAAEAILRHIEISQHQEYHTAADEYIIVVLPNSGESRRPSLSQRDVDEEV